MSRLENFIMDGKYPRFAEYISFMDSCTLDESISDETFDELKNVANKIGLRIKRSDTIFTYIKDASKNVFNMFKLLSKYLNTDIKDKQSRRKIEGEIRKAIKNTNKKEMVAFLGQLDKNTIGIGAILRHLLQATFGIEIEFYTNWVTDKKYLEKEVKDIKKVLKKMGDTEKEIETITKFGEMVKRL